MSRRASLRPVSLSGAVQACLLLLSLVLVSGTVAGELFSGIVVGCLAFIAWRFGVVRAVFLFHLRKGARQARAGLYTAALKSFALSAQAWERWRWIDNGRGLLLGSAARWPFRSLSRYNEAWCLAQLGHAPEARAALGALLTEQPEMHVARDLLASLSPVEPCQGPPVEGPDPWLEPTGDGAWDDLLASAGPGDAPVHDEPTLDPQGPEVG